MTKLARGLLVFLITLVVFQTAALDCVPPVEKDTLIYHLAIPKIWLRAGGFVETPWMDNSYFPMNLQLLYLGPLALGWDIGAKFIHHFFGLLTALVIFLHLRQRLTINWALTGVLIFISTPVVIRLAASAYVDLGLTFFIIAAVLGLVHWQDSGRSGYFILSATALGLGLGVKYSGLMALPLLGLGVLWLRNRAGDTPFKAGFRGLTFLGLAVLIFSPWLIKNFLLTGNPTYPLFHGLWGTGDQFSERYTVSTFALRQYMFGESFWQTLLIPIRFFFQGRDFSIQYFDGVLNPFLILLPPVALFRPASWELRPLALFSALWIILVVFTTPYMILRYTAPALPLLVIISVFSLERIHRFFKRRGWSVMGSTVSALLLTTIIIFNGQAVLNFWQHLDPVPFLTGRESREAYLTRKQAYYPAVKFINRHLDPRAGVLLLVSGDRGYYLDREYRHGALFSGLVLKPIMDRAASWQDIHQGLLDQKITHILTNEARLARHLKENWPREKLLLWDEFARHGWKKLFQRRGYSVYELTRISHRLSTAAVKTLLPPRFRDLSP